MSQMAIQAVDNGKLSIEPPCFKNQWKMWLNKSVDWCLSRQLWWGHRVPAYYCEFKNQSTWIAAHNEEEAHNKAAKYFKINANSTNTIINIRQDDDVLDTWFSSGLLPFSLQEWPQSKQLNRFPLDILVSGHDILFFWIARMVILSHQIMNDVPFRKVLLHGIICDEQGKKMSKSLGNVVTPEQVINGATLKVS